MNIKQAKEACLLLLKYPQAVVPFIHGKPGIGKSAIVNQIADYLGICFIDFRLSQLESSDIRGIPTPDLKMGSSRWLPPETIPFETFRDLPVPNDPKGRNFGHGGILFIDEINRARFDVLQSVFQLILDRSVGLHKLLPNWFIVCAGNLGEEDGTEVTEIDDAAFNNRFAHFEIEDNGIFDCWMEWAENEGKVHNDVVGFLKTKPSAIYVAPKNGERSFATPRSWDKFSKVLQQNPEKDPAYIAEILGKPIVGTTIVGFFEYLKEKSKIKPKDVIENYHRPEIATLIRGLDRTRKYGLTEEVLTYIKEHDQMDKRKISNLHNFIIENLEPDHFIAAFKRLVNMSIRYHNGKKEETVEFLDAYLDEYPDMNDKIADILYGAKNVRS